MSERNFHFFAALRQLFTDPKRRPLAIRYTFPFVTAFLTTVVACLPMIVFRSVGGDSDAHSLFYWQHVNFFGVGARWGALDFLQNASAGDQYLGLYRSVTVLYLLSALFFFLGVVFSACLSVSALYLLFTEENNAKGKQIGRIFRVAFGNRAMLLIPSAMLLIPFTFHHLLAYCYTIFQSFSSMTRFRPIDPLILAVLLFLSNVIVALWAKPKEKHAGYVIFRTSDLHAEERKRRIAEEREWEAEVQSDAEREPIVLKTKQDPPKISEDQTESDSTKFKSEESALSEEDLYGKTVVISECAEPESEHPAIIMHSSEKSVSNGKNEDADREIRNSISALFAEDDSSTTLKKK